MINFLRLILRGFGWRLGALAAVFVVGLLKHYL